MTGQNLQRATRHKGKEVQLSPAAAALSDLSMAAITAQREADTPRGKGEWGGPGWPRDYSDHLEHGGPQEKSRIKQLPD